MPTADLPKMDLIVNEGHNRPAYPGALPVEISKSDIPEFRGGVTMTILFQRVQPEPITAPITIDTNLHGGVPCVGTERLPISHILQKLAIGISPQSLIQEYPDLSLEDIQLALKASSWVMRDPSIDWSVLDITSMMEFQDEMQAWQSLTNNILGSSSESLGE